MALSAGTRLGPYEILSALGAGGMGEVYRARDTRLDRVVAIKVLAEHLSRNPQLHERFEREARAISSLSHPHICALYDVGQQDGIDYLVMEFLEGETLAHRLKKGPLAPGQALQIAVQVTDALDTAHKHAVIHRDLKPGNIMLTKSGAKLLDFGLAKMRTTEAVAGMTALPTQTAPLTGEGAILGTLQYMAPEQLEGKEADARTDIFALGAVIYEMATGRKAFAGKSQASLISAIMTSEPPPISTLQSMAPPLLDHVVRSGLAKEPEMRWQTAHDVLLQLTWIAAGNSQAAFPVVPHRGARDRLGWILAGCLLAALIAGGVMVYLRPAPEAPVVQFEVASPQKEVILFPSISPDGKHMAYSARTTSTSSQRMIFLRSLNSLDTNPLPGTEDEVGYSWSPDSSQIAFGTASALKRISITGGAPQVICNHTASNIAWNRDGVILFWGGRGQGLLRVAAAGGEPKTVTKLDPTRQEIGHVFTQFLPDGRHFIYLAASDKPENSGTFLGSLDSPEIKRIHDGKANTFYAQPGYLLFIRGTSTDPVGPGSGALMAQRFDIRRAELSGDPVVVADSVATFVSSDPVLFGYFSVSQNGVLTYSHRGAGAAGTQLVWFDRSGKRLGTVGEPADYSNPAISPDQKMVAVGKRDPQTKTRDIWVNDLQRGTSSRLTFDPADDTNPTWSPDSARIAFTSDRKGHRDIYVKAASGVGEEQMLVESAENKSIEDWSADGQYLVWGVDETGYEWLFSFRDHKTLPFLQAKFPQMQCRFSPNHGGPPRWIAYSSFETGAQQVYVRSFAGVLSGSGGKWQISTGGGSEPVWRGDGKELFYLNGNKLMAVEVSGDGESFRAGIPKELFEARLPVQLRNRYIVTSDGKRFLMNTLLEEQEHASLRVVLNWPGLLKR
jgi:eukaryotic-like serine/threonine-protein kinase